MKDVIRTIEDSDGQEWLEVHYDPDTGCLTHLRCYDVISDMWLTVETENLNAVTLVKVQGYIGRWMADAPDENDELYAETKGEFEREAI